jgi:hypothetical protein
MTSVLLTTMMPSTAAAMELMDNAPKDGGVSIITKS